jgi:DNA sulfur modification protein DndB
MPMSCNGVASIKEAIKKHPEFANVSIPVIFLPFRNRAAVRQLFSDLNLNAKPVNKSIGRSFEMRDPVAVIAKNIEKLVPLFDGRVNHLSNSLPASSNNVITVNTLYEGTDVLLRGLGHNADDLAGPESAKLQAVSQEIADIWKRIGGALPGWADVIAGTESPNSLREQYVFARGIGWQALAQAAAVMAQEAGPLVASQTRNYLEVDLVGEGQ